MKAYMEKLFDRLTQETFDIFFDVLFFFIPAKWIKPYLPKIIKFHFLYAALMGWLYCRAMPPQEREVFRRRIEEKDRRVGRSEEWIRESQETLLEQERIQERRRARARQIKKSGKAVFAILGDELALPFAAFTVWLMLMVVVFLSGTPERVRLATTLVFVAIALFLAVKLVLSRKRGS